MVTCPAAPGHTPRDGRTEPCSHTELGSVRTSQDSALGPAPPYRLRGRISGTTLGSRGWKSPRVTVAGLLEGRYQVSFSVNSLQLILKSGSPGHGVAGGGRVAATLASRALGSHVTKGLGPGYP